MSEDKSRTAIRLDLYPEYRELVEKWLEGLHFNSKRDATEMLLVLGAMALEITAERPITAESFASALYMVAGRVLDGELRGHVSETVEAFKKWRELQDMRADRPISLSRKLTATG